MSLKGSFARCLPSSVYRTQNWDTNE